MEPKEWLRCNNCFSLMCKSKDPFSLTFCGHIFCSKCIRKASKQCPHCKIQNVSTLQMLEPIKPEIKHCFESTTEPFEKIRQAVSFQEMQSVLNCKRLNEVEKKYLLLKVEYHRKSEEIKKTLEKNSQLLKQNKELKFELESLGKLNKLSKSRALMTPSSNISSLPGSAQSFRSFDSERSGYSFPRPEPFQQSLLTPILGGVNLESEFRNPNSRKVPRSVDSSSRSSLNSSRGTPFTNYASYSSRR